MAPRGAFSPTLTLLHFKSFFRHFNPLFAGDTVSFLPVLALSLFCGMMKRFRTYALGGLLLITGSSAFAQSTAINFHHLSVKTGLNDGIINAITQDKFGYMWFASYGALNRFNGTTIRKFEHVLGDSLSAPGGIVHSLFCHSTGRLFVGGDEGLVEFDYRTGSFQRQGPFYKQRITYIGEASPGELLVVANNRLYRYVLSGQRKTVVQPAGQSDFFSRHALFSGYRKGNLFYAGTQGGYIIYDLHTQQASFQEVRLLKGNHADALIVDALGRIWISNVFSFQLIRVDGKTQTEKAISQIPAITARGVQQSFLDFAADDHHVWIATSLTGLIQYNIHTDSLVFHQKNILRPGSIAENILRTIHRSADGTIWVSMLGGVDYFHPDRSIFDILYPFPEYDANQLARGFSEDQQGYYWYTTGDGVVRFHPNTRQYRIWKNEAGRSPALYYNSSRAVLADGNDVWIATGKGINRYELSTGKMHFLTKRDSLPEIFYLNINKDSKGFIWFCSNMADGLYYKDPSTKKIQSIRYHPVLKRYTGYGVRRVFEDSRKRLWLGFSGQGYAMFDPANGQTRYWYNTIGGDSSFNSNLVIDIAEDKNGVIWLSTFSGVRGLYPDGKTQVWLSVANGLPSNVTNGIKVDTWNRLWMGTSAGLCFMDSSRKNIYRFDESYGIPGMELPEHQAHQTRDGRFVFPSNKGYIQFDPDKLPREVNTFPFFIAGLDVFDKPLSVGLSWTDTPSVRLRYDQNFFSITLEALNYTNPEQTWYAYKLDGLEKEWHITQNPKAAYTSVPGGDYVFRYKVAAGTDFSRVSEKTLEVQVGTVVYKTTWFRIGVVVLLFGAFLFLYQYRLRQQEKLFRLEGRTQQLEKEKAQVMYESLKQQLNPHFLFNSLTSLSGLITTDQRLAKNFLKQMSKIYRYILKSRDSDTVTLREEIDFGWTYIELQKTRFKEGLVVNIRIDEEHWHRRIPPVTIQNMVENAIKHNIIDEASPLIIDMTVEEEYLVIRNNLQKKHIVETSNRQGLNSLQSLYRYLSHRPVLIEESETQFCIKLPLI